MILGLESGRAIDAGLPLQTWSRNSKWVFYDEQLLIRIQLGMDGGHIAESNVIASSHGGKHTGHVVEENLNRALGCRVLVLPLARVEGGVRYWAWRQRCSSIVRLSGGYTPQFSALLALTWQEAQGEQGRPVA